MKETELRIGNLILFDGEIVSVNEIKQDFNDEPYLITIKHKDGMFSDIPIEELKPIQLTEKWMVNFGFKIKEVYPKNELHPNGWYTYDKGDISITDDFNWNSIGNGARIKYVHKLQNFCFAFTSKELTFTP